MFQSTHPRGVRPGTERTAIERITVSIHAPAWGATALHGSDAGRVPGFNPRTRVGCDSRPQHSPRRWRGFNPRTRVGCDIGAQLVLTQAGGVSIHAPAWGATWEELDRFRYYSVFQSTHPRGVRRLANTHSFDEIMFQSTHPRGVRRGKQHQGAGRSPVSIHAPAWGATVLRIKQRLMLARFNPRTRVGCDSQKQANEDSIHGFNPRTRVGCDFSNPQ